MTKQTELLKRSIKLLDKYHENDDFIAEIKEALENLEKDPSISRKEQPAKEQLTDSQCDEFRRLPMSFNDMVRAIYKAGQEALEQPAHDSDCAVHNAPAYPVGECNCSVKKQAQEPKNGIELEWYCKGWDDAEKDLATQEPVAYVVAQNDGDIRSEVISEYLKIGTELYTTPPTRKWRNLSDDEIDAIFPLGDDADVLDVAREIEAKLREKNG